MITANSIQSLALYQVLSSKFEESVGTPLTLQHLHFLGSKLFGSFSGDNFADKSVTWDQFTKRSMKGCDFTFWRWFYAVMKLVADELKDIWKEGHIVGFLSRKDAEERLKNAPPGTFLMRFSERVLGGLTIAYKDSTRGKILMLEPFTGSELKLLPLPSQIMRLPQLTTLHPSTSKEVFATFIRPDLQHGSSSVPGYARLLMVPQVVE